MATEEEVQALMGEVGEQIRQSMLELPTEKQNALSAGAEEGGMMTIEGVAEIVKATFIYAMEPGTEIEKQEDTPDEEE